MSINIIGKNIISWVGSLLRLIVSVFQDPVCGSAHCSLALYWCKELGKRDFVAYQVLLLNLSHNVYCVLIVKSKLMLKSSFGYEE